MSFYGNSGFFRKFERFQNIPLHLKMKLNIFNRYIMEDHIVCMLFHHKNETKLNQVSGIFYLMFESKEQNCFIFTLISLVCLLPQHQQ